MRCVHVEKDQSELGILVRQNQHQHATTGTDHDRVALVATHNHLMHVPSAQFHSGTGTEIQQGRSHPADARVVQFRRHDAGDDQPVFGDQGACLNAR